ncbi:retrotransposon protein [Cucumis melo var. makuwa]|uniref:Retrotransposon protein n=1 Tax=Cucumis melo var. makuwa TaxID=1194695 RepID=A0A5A7V5R4_CUCMM|nr:retrotransposon protein [Cucumis melo var. makuwa]
MMAEKLPGCQVRATIVIDCRIKTLKRTFQAIAKMRGPACSGFGATGRFAETFADVGPNEPGGYDGFDMADKNEEFPPVYSQGIDLSQHDVHASRPSRGSKGRTGSSGSKRKRGSQREVDVEAIHLALDQANE